MNTLRLNIINLHAPYRVWQKPSKPDHYYLIRSHINPIAPAKHRLNGGDSIVISAEGRHRLSQYRSTDSRGRE